MPKGTQDFEKKTDSIHGIAAGPQISDAADYNEFRALRSEVFTPTISPTLPSLPSPDAQSTQTTSVHQNDSASKPGSIQNQATQQLANLQSVVQQQVAPPVSSATGSNANLNPQLSSELNRALTLPEEAREKSTTPEDDQDSNDSAAKKNSANSLARYPNPLDSAQQIAPQTTPALSAALTLQNLNLPAPARQATAAKPSSSSSNISSSASTESDSQVESSSAATNDQSTAQADSRQIANNNPQPDLNRVKF